MKIKTTLLFPLWIGRDSELLTTYSVGEGVGKVLPYIAVVRTKDTFSMDSNYVNN